MYDGKVSVNKFQLTYPVTSTTTTTTTYTMMDLMRAEEENKANILERSRTYGDGELFVEVTDSVLVCTM